jgi:hypothetical protein
MEPLVKVASPYVNFSFGKNLVPFMGGPEPDPEPRRNIYLESRLGNTGLKG